MADRSVLQWDKDDCARAGLVKFDLLGLGMLSALHVTVDHIKAFYGLEMDLAALPQDPAVYEMLCKADSVGVFQVESRAQMATLPRLRPRTFYDLVIEVALIRPGPIQGRSVHPYLRRRNGTEKVTYLHPLLENSLKKTLGVPLFQEQLMQMAIDVAGFSPAEADQLRQAMGCKAQRPAHGALTGTLLFRHGRAGCHRSGSRPDLGTDGRVCQFRFPREPFGELRLPRLFLGVAKIALPGRFPGRPARQPADGFLVPPDARPGRPAPRCRGAPARRERQRRLFCAGTSRR